jgi:hypothetical protein
MYKFNFYADKPGLYHNRLFSFTIKELIERDRLLVLFNNNGNTFRTAFITDITSGANTQYTQQDINFFIEAFLLGTTL